MQRMRIKKYICVINDWHWSDFHFNFEGYFLCESENLSNITHVLPSSALYATWCQETYIQLKFGWGQFSSSFGLLCGIFGPNQDRTQGGTRMTGLESADQNHIGALECDERAPLEDLKPTIDWSYMSTQWKTLFWAEIWTIRPLSGFVLIQIWSAQPIFWYKGRSPEKKLLFLWIVSKFPPPPHLDNLYNFVPTSKYKTWKSALN